MIILGNTCGNNVSTDYGQPSVVRLNISTGAIDSGFDPFEYLSVTDNVYNDPGTVKKVKCIDTDSDGSDEIFIGGAFRKVSNVSRYSLAKLNSDGSLNTTFSPPLWSSSLLVTDIVSNPENSSILVVGRLRPANGSACGTTTSDAYWLIEHDWNSGAILNCFKIPYAIDDNQDIRTISINENGILVGGNFEFTDSGTSVTYENLFLLNWDFELQLSPSITDLDFADWDNNSDGVFKILPYNDGYILGGLFSNVNLETNSRNHLVAVNSNWEIDPNYYPGVGTSINGYVKDLAMDECERLIVCGDFVDVYPASADPDVEYNTTVRFLNSAGVAVVDPEYYNNHGLFNSNVVQDMILLNNGSLIVCGSFKEYGDTPITRRYIAKLNGDEPISLSFDYCKTYLSDTEFSVTATATVEPLSANYSWVVQSYDNEGAPDQVFSEAIWDNESENSFVGETCCNSDPGAGIFDASIRYDITLSVTTCTESCTRTEVLIPPTQSCQFLTLSAEQQSLKTTNGSVTGASNIATSKSPELKVDVQLGRMNIHLPDSFAKEDNIVCQIFDLKGSLIWVSRFGHNDAILQVPIAAWIAGVYSVRLSNSERVLTTSIAIVNSK